MSANTMSDVNHDLKREANQPGVKFNDSSLGYVNLNLVLIIIIIISAKQWTLCVTLSLCQPLLDANMAAQAMVEMRLILHEHQTLILSF